MRRIFTVNVMIIIIEPLTTAQHYFLNVTELFEGIRLYQQQRIINFYMKIMDAIILSIMKVYYNARNKLVKTGKCISESMKTWIQYVEYFGFLFNSSI